MSLKNEVTLLLCDLNAGHKDALDRLFSIIYDELKRLAANIKRFERADHTINTTALVHELYLRLVDQTHIVCQNRHHFFCIAAEVMRHYFIDHARKHRAVKRGGGKPKVPLDFLDIEPANENDETEWNVLLKLEYSERLLALDTALSLLEKNDERLAQVVKLKFFSGLSIRFIAENLNISEATVKRDWNFAKSLLYREMKNILDR